MSVGTSRDRKRRVRSAKSRDEDDAVEEGEETSWKGEGRRPPLFLLLLLLRVHIQRRETCHY